MINAPVHILCRQIEPSAAVERCVREEVAALARECDHIMACHVCIERINGRCAEGATFRVNLDLTMPGRQIAVHSGNTRPASKDLCATLRDAFATVRTLLHEHVTAAPRQSSVTETSVCG